MDGMKAILTPHAPKAIGAYSQGMEHNGIWYFSGQIGLDPKTMLLRTGFEEQLDQVLHNMDQLVLSQNLTRKNIIKTTIFLVDLACFPLVNKAYEKFFSPPYPARSCVQVSALPKDALIEIEMIAVKDR